MKSDAQMIQKTSKIDPKNGAKIDEKSINKSMRKMMQK